MSYNIPNLPLGVDLEDKRILKQLAKSSRLLGELKGVAEKIPNKDILISALTLMEAKDSSEVENIVTTHDELYKADLSISTREFSVSLATKEVMNYREAIHIGYNLVKKNAILSNSNIKKIQQTLEGNIAGFRTVPGTILKDNKQNVIYTPPQDVNVINELMQNLEQFINDDSISDLDCLVKMAVIHHQFESIHPFYDGNGRTGRIICILYLVAKGLLDLPILYISRYITQNKAEYYRLLQAIRETENNEQQWRDWVYFMLVGVEQVAQDTIVLIEGISKLMSEYKIILKPVFGRIYKHELLNNLFFHPYTKIEYLERDMMVTRKTATKYLDMIVEEKLLDKMRIGKNNYYINTQLINLFTNHQTSSDNLVESIESVYNID
ncbi:MAG: Fic/DOC family N-terminal domain-containing protein [Rikenellaceae bacterium]